MKRLVYLLIFFAPFVGLIAEESKSIPKPEAVPSLSISDKVALQSLEDKKNEARQIFNKAAQTEGAIAKDFTTAHPGWRLNLENMQVEKIPDSPVKKDKP